MRSPKSMGGGSEITYVHKYFPHTQRSFEKLSKQSYKRNFLPGKGMRIRKHLLVEHRDLRKSNNHVAIPFPALSRVPAPSHHPHPPMPLPPAEILCRAPDFYGLLHGETDVFLTHHSPPGEPQSASVPKRRHLNS